MTDVFYDCEWDGSQNTHILNIKNIIFTYKQVKADINECIKIFRSFRTEDDNELREVMETFIKEVENA